CAKMGTTAYFDYW
nr:immunoglobulin heavy chain junction region [Mus musculus]